MESSRPPVSLRMISWSRSMRPPARTFLSVAGWLNGPISRTEIQRLRRPTIMHEARRNVVNGVTGEVIVRAGGLGFTGELPRSPPSQTYRYQRHARQSFLQAD